MEKVALNESREVLGDRDARPEGFDVAQGQDHVQQLKWQSLRLLRERCYGGGLRDGRV